MESVTIFLGRGAAAEKCEICVSKLTKRRAVMRSSEEEHMENALASGADEGRDKLRKAAGSCK